MILLGLNGGLGNTDVGELPLTAIDLKGGWLDYPRPKTGIQRRIPLWPETVEAVKAVMENRRDPKAQENDRLLFVGRRGESYIGNHRGYRVTQEFNRVLTKAGIEGRTFYDLRRTFQTIAEGARDWWPCKASWATLRPAAICRQFTGSGLTTTGCRPSSTTFTTGYSGRWEREDFCEGASAMRETRFLAAAPSHSLQGETKGVSIMAKKTKSKDTVLRYVGKSRGDSIDATMIVHRSWGFSNPADNVVKEAGGLWPKQGEKTSPDFLVAVVGCLAN